MGILESQVFAELTQRDLKILRTEKCVWKELGPGTLQIYNRASESVE
jgi:hypothetical protein